MILDNALVMKATPSVYYKLLISGKLLNRGIDSQIPILKNGISPARSASLAGKTRQRQSGGIKENNQRKVIVSAVQRGGRGKRFYIINNW